MGQDGPVGIATRYGLDGPVRGANPGGVEIFRTLSHRFYGLPNLLYNRKLVIPGKETGETWRKPPTPI